MPNREIVQPNSNDSKVLLFGVSVIVVVFGIFFGWMAIAPLATSVVAVGQVSVDFNKKTLQHLEGGIIKKILIQESDFVQKDDPLIILDDAQLRISINAVNDQYLRAIATIARLQAQKRKSTSINFPNELDEHHHIKEEQMNILLSKVKSIQEEEIITMQRIEQFNKLIEQQNSLIFSKTKQLETVTEEIEEQEELVKSKLTDKQRLRDLEREKLNLTNQITTAELEIVRLNSQIEEAKSTLTLRHKEFDNEIDTLLSQTQAIAVEASAKRDSLLDSLERTVLKAPTSGYITGLDIHTEGGVIPPSQPILDIVPKDSDFFILARVSTHDIDKLSPGLLADVRFTAFNVQQTYVVEAKLTRISADSFIDENSGEPYYQTKLELTERGKQQMIENGFFLVPGMPADIMISVDKRTVLSYLVKPFTDMVARGFNEE